ncbi:MAG: 30S ribosomal protein S6 [Phycisphaeraceae bacterium]
MAEIRTRLYEGLILLSQSAAGDLNAALEHVRGLLERHQAKIEVIRKWDERKLAYTIKGHKRGTYLLTYFYAPSNQIIAIDRDFNLSEQVLRTLIIAADHVGEVELDLARRGEEITKTEAALRSEGEEVAEPIGGEESETIVGIEG